mgnify:CR=1 FL=1
MATTTAADFSPIAPAPPPLPPPRSSSTTTTTTKKQQLVLWNEKLERPSSTSFEKPIGRGAYGVVVSFGPRGVLKHTESSTPAASLREMAAYGLFPDFPVPHMLTTTGMRMTSSGGALITMSKAACTVGQYMRTTVHSSNVDTSARWLITATVLRVVITLGSFGLAHRDLKWNNVLICEDGHVWVVDHGQMRMVPSVCQTKNSLTGYIQTRGLRAPELMFSSSKTAQYGTKPEVFAVGCMLWELWSQTSPGICWRSDLAAALQLCERMGTPPSLAARGCPVYPRRADPTSSWPDRCTDAPVWLRRLIVGMCEPDPAKRLSLTQISLDLNVTCLLQRCTPRFDIGCDRASKIPPAPPAHALVLVPHPEIDDAVRRVVEENGGLDMDTTGRLGLMMKAILLEMEERPKPWKGFACFSNKLWVATRSALWIVVMLAGPSGSALLRMSMPAAVPDVLRLLDCRIYRILIPLGLKRFSLPVETRSLLYVKPPPSPMSPPPSLCPSVPGVGVTITRPPSLSSPPSSSSSSPPRKTSSCCMKRRRSMTSQK